ncbi:uncharacterized protein LOC106442132 [Brassica napus]|uniref:uncharacterized protein LOC106442132 n=1 Tax=Brassica napus TaxID=3708 RepID=UPI0006AB763C|nr:uncharacterized protein LOC106442132 [Brassica napus]
MSFGCILEMRVRERKADGILKKVFKDWSFLTNYEHNQGGRIWLVWRDEVSMIPVYKSDQLITCSVKLPDQEEFFYTCVYANNLAEERMELWDDLCHHNDSNLFRNKSWIIVGDFNEILEAEESSSFEHMGRTPSEMREFQHMVLHCRFSDMGFQGPLHTWCNKREEGVICKKLDRVPMNDVALLRFSSTYSVFEAGGSSDHLRCKFHLLPESEKLRRPFKFVNVIGNLPDFLPMVKDYWDTTQRLYHSTSAMYKFSKKLKNLKPLIRELGKAKLGNLTRKAREAHDILCVKQQLEVKEEAVRFFSEFLNQIPESYVGTTTEELKKLLEFRCSDEDVVCLKKRLRRKISIAWPVIAHDFTVAIQYVFRFGFLPKGVNSTILALVVSKILANRLKVLLPRVITENQSAFIKGRLLLENVLLASELVKDYHKEAESGGNWVPAKFIQWIKLCISTPSFSVQVNGELAGYFQSTRGLSQGCSLSPYLFVLCMNVLSHKIDQAVKEKRFKFHPRCKELSLTHLCFANDLMVFVEGTKVSIEGALSVFAKWSGLYISIEKSTVFMAGVAEEERSKILRNFPFAEGNLPVRYLGLPLMAKGMCKPDYLPLVERVRSRINTWNCRFLSYAGRLQLINAVLMSLVNYWAAVFRLPNQCIKEIEQLCASFLWSGPTLKATGAKVAWKSICKPKEEGGLGIRSLKEVNKVYGLKLIWRLLLGESLWGKWIKVFLLKKKSFWEVKSSTQWSDKGILFDLLGDRGIIDLVIRKEATIEEAVTGVRRRRKHRVEVLNDIVTELITVKEKLNHTLKDVNHWRWRRGYEAKFSTQETWLLLRETSEHCSWAK